MKLNRIFSKERQMAKKHKHIKGSSMALAKREMKIKMDLRFHLTPVKRAVIRIHITTNAHVNLVKGELFCIVEMDRN